MGCQTPETHRHVMEKGPGPNGEIDCCCGSRLATFAQFAEHVEHQLDKGNVLTNAGVLTTHADANPTNGLEKFLAAGLPAMNAGFVVVDASPDPINHPPHYTFGKYEVIDVIEDWGLSFHLAQVLKYVARSKHKGNELEDLKKAKFFLDRVITNLEKK